MIRKRGAFYRPKRQGYTDKVEQAGHFTRKEAEAEAEARIEPGIITAHRLAEFADEDPRSVLRELADAERSYRRAYELYGVGNVITLRAWDEMRRAGDRARALLAGPKVGP